MKEELESAAAMLAPLGTFRPVLSWNLWNRFVKEETESSGRSTTTWAASVPAALLQEPEHVWRTAGAILEVSWDPGLVRL